MSSRSLESLRDAFLDALTRSAVVLSAPTGTGKSTLVPRWCATEASSRVVVVEPRRIACRTLAARVSDLEGTPLGERVGYVVRDERNARDDTRIVFATPGIVLRDPTLLERATTVIVDELHERNMEVDLLVALLRARHPRRALVLMSATLDAEHIATAIHGTHLAADARAFPVDVRYVAKNEALPDPDDLASRVRDAVTQSRNDPGDVLVFLPGKAEIDACATLLRGGPDHIVPLHSGLSLDEQRRAFVARDRRKVILATNVAETSLTIPGVGVVIDSGLVRQTRYQAGRGSLALVAIADDSATQRAGRAGRTAPGIAYRLWGRAARLAPLTLPEIHRESLVPLVLTAAAWGARPEDLPFLDAPKPHALAAARADLEAWGAIDPSGAVTDAGRGLFALPVDAPLARWLVEARRTGCLDDAIDVVAALSVGRPMFLPGPPPDHEEDDLRRSGCDATALARAVRIGRPDVHHLSSIALDEARRNRTRIRRAMSLPDKALSDERIDRDSLARAALAADPRIAHIARPRGRTTAYANGGTELDLARESAVRNAKDVQAILVLDTRAFGTGTDTRLLVTCATPIPLSWIAKAGLGRDRIASVSVEGRRVMATIERVYAGRVVGTRDEVPKGELARDAIAQLFLRGSVFKGAVGEAKERFARLGLAARLVEGGAARELGTFEEWVRARVEQLGVESGEDLALLSASDLLPAQLEGHEKAMIEKDYPLHVDVGDARYVAEYDLPGRQVVLRMVRGSRKEPPPLAYLPRFPGLRVCVASGRGTVVVRERS